MFSKAISQQCIYQYFPNARLTQFTNGDRAHEFLEASIKAHDKIDLFITDINHPGMQGDYLAHFIRTHEKAYSSPFVIPILVVSMVGE